MKGRGSQRRRARGESGHEPDAGPHSHGLPRVLLDAGHPAPEHCWFQLDVLETAPGRSPRLHGWWIRRGHGPVDGRASLYLEYRITPRGISARIYADLPDPSGARRRIAAFDDLPQHAWTSALAAVLAEHPYLGHLDAAAPASPPRWARAALAYLLTH